MYFFESSASRKPLHAMVIGTVVVAFILFFTSTVEGIPFPVLFQSAACLFFGAAIYLVTRYSLRLYRYAIEPNGIIDAGGVELCDLVVTEITGKKMKVVARVALRDIGEVAVVRRSDKAARESVRAALCKDRQVFPYSNNPILPEECYISLPEEGAVLVIPADEGMIRILRV